MLVIYKKESSFGQTAQKLSWEYVICVYADQPSQCQERQQILFQLVKVQGGGKAQGNIIETWQFMNASITFICSMFKGSGFKKSQYNLHNV